MIEKQIVSDSMEFNRNMMNPQIDKMSPRHIAACVEEQPTLKDPNEVMIREKVKDLLNSTPEAKRIAEEATNLIRDSFQDLYAHHSDPSYVRRKNQEWTARFAKITNSRIVSGEEYLDSLDKGKPVLFAANHDATFRMGGGLDLEGLKRLGFDATHPVEDIHYPHIPFYGALQPVAERLGDDIYMAAEEEPGTLGELYRATGSIDVPPAEVLPASQDGGVGRVDMLAEASRELFDEYPNSALTVFPEGATTGKRNGGNMQELGEFHAGLFAIAASLVVPIVLLAYRFNPDRGFEISIAGTVRLGKESSRKEIRGAAEHAKEITQSALGKLYSKQ